MREYACRVGGGGFGMVRPVEGTCDTGGGFLRQACLNDAIASCVYCGRKFCDEHGERGPDHIDTCSRKACRKKLADVLAHQQWKQRGQEQNVGAICAVEECGERMGHRCNRCQLMFCIEHVRNMRMVSRSSMRDQGRIVVCGHCRGRQGIWD